MSAQLATPQLLEDRDHAREVQSILSKAWNNAYRVKHQGEVETEVERIAHGALRRIEDEAIARFGNNKAHPDCDYCLKVSVFGGPSHEPSSLCRSGKRAHCTCDLCF